MPCPRPTRGKAPCALETKGATHLHRGAALPGVSHTTVDPLLCVAWGHNRREVRSFPVHDPISTEGLFPRGLHA